MSDRPTVRSATEQLTEAIRESDEFLQYKALKDSVMVSDTNRALLKEYQRTQTRLQMAAAGGADASADEVERFNKLSALLYMNSDVAQYLVAQMRLLTLAGDVFQQITKAAELEMDLPGM